MHADFDEFWEGRESSLLGVRSDLIVPIARAIAYEAWQEGKKRKSISETFGESQAFPCDRDNQYWGLTKREYFAAKALQGLLGNPPHMTTTEALEEKIWLGYDFAREAAAMADALIAALNKSLEKDEA